VRDFLSLIQSAQGVFQWGVEGKWTCYSTSGLSIYHLVLNIILCGFPAHTTGIGSSMHTPSGTPAESINYTSERKPP
jgi:hypothetical protein